MEANKRQIKDIFNQGRQLIVPFFQRSYVWGEEQWERFSEDMTYICQSKQEYFMGAVILKQQQTSTNWISDVRIIIDGQQRLTTLCVFMKALCLLTGKNSMINRFRLTEDEEHYNTNAILHSKIDRKAFDFIMNLTDRETEVKNDNQIKKAFNYFIKKIKTDEISFNEILKYVQFVVIDLSKDDDEQKIFDTINSLGVSLSTGELLKNYFFDENNISEYEDSWAPAFEDAQEKIDFWNQNVTIGRLKKNNLDNLLYYYLQIKLQDLKVPSEIRRNQYRRWDGMFSNYKTLLKEFCVSRPELITGICEYAQIYIKYLSSDVVTKDSDFSDPIVRINFLIWKMDCTTIIPYILFVLKNVVSEEEKNKLFEYIESYIIRRLFANRTNKSYSDLFSEALLKEEYLSIDGLRGFFKGREEQDLSMPTDTEVIEGTYNHRWTNGKALAALYLMETKLHSNMDSTKVVPYDRYSLEHLMPQKPYKWPETAGYDPENRKKAIYMLGNMAMITSTLNSSISNGVWSDKLSGNSKHSGLKDFAAGLTLMKEVLTKTEWNEKCIEKRSIELGERAIEIWKQ